MASSQIYDRVKNHLFGSHKNEIYALANDLETELYIYPIENKFNDCKEYSNEIHFIEYSVMRYLIHKGYKAINSTNSFPIEIKQRYENNSSHLNMNEFLVFDSNLFEKKS